MTNVINSNEQMIEKINESSSEQEKCGSKYRQ